MWGLAFRSTASSSSGGGGGDPPTTIAWSSVTGRPVVFPTDMSNVSGLTAAMSAKLELNGAGDLDIGTGALLGSVDYASLTGTPAAFPTDIGSVSGLTAALGAKLELNGAGDLDIGAGALVGAVDYASLTGVPTAFPTDIASVAGLQQILTDLQEGEGEGDPPPEGGGGDPPPPEEQNTTLSRLAAAESHSVVLLTGAVHTAGNQVSGRLGNGAINGNTMSFASIASRGTLSGKTVVGVSASWSHTLALDSAGAVHAWGSSTDGQIGDGHSLQRSEPVLVSTGASSSLEGKTVTAIAAGTSHSAALCSDGSIHCWGWGSNGRLGAGNFNSSTFPVQVNADSGSSSLFGRTVVAIVCGTSSCYALDDGGLVHAWGWNNTGQLGDGTLNDTAYPVLVNTASGLSSLHGKAVTAIGAGSTHVFAVDADGVLHTWGLNGNGQLGVGNLTNSAYPVVVDTTSGTSSLHGKTVVYATGGTSHSLVIDSTGAVHAFGRGDSGRLGDGGTTQRTLPVLVNADTGSSALFGKNIVDVSAGLNFSLALDDAGVAYAWGANFSGRLGDGSTDQRDYPVAVAIST